MEHIIMPSENPMLAWLRGLLFPSDAASERGLTPEEQRLLSMDLEQVLGSHNSWRKSLEETIKMDLIKPLNLSESANDRKCTQGRWLEGPVRKLYSHLPEYQSAKKAHAHFHFCATEILIYHNDGNAKKALELLNSSFRDAVNANQVELVRLFVAIRNLH